MSSRPDNNQRGLLCLMGTLQAGESRSEGRGQRGGGGSVSSPWSCSVQCEVIVRSWRSVRGKLLHQGCKESPSSHPHRQGVSWTGGRCACGARYWQRAGYTGQSLQEPIIDCETDGIGEGSIVMMTMGFMDMQYFMRGGQM